MTIKSRLASEISKDGFLAAKSGELKKPLSCKYYKKVRGFGTFSCCHILDGSFIY